MALNLAPNKDALLKAYEDVRNDGSTTDWAVFGYEGQTTTLKVVETGEGLDEMAEELSGSKIMYAYCRIEDPNSGLAKYVLINWQGEAAPEQVKFKCAKHIPDITRFLQGIHVTINARIEDDVEPDFIKTKVSKSSGSNYGFHKEKAQPVEPPKPVGSVYKRIVPERDISGKSRDKFWSETEVEEKKRLEAERKKKLEEQHNLDKERKEREAKEAMERDKQMRDRMRSVHEQRSQEERIRKSSIDDEKLRWEEEQQRLFQEEEEHRQRSKVLGREKASEAKSLAANKASNARAMFERKASENEQEKRAPPPPRKIKHGFMTQAPQEPPSRKEPITLPTDEPVAKPPREPSHPAREPSPPRREPSPPRREPSPARREPSPPRREPSPPRREPSPPPKEPAPVQVPKGRNLLAEGLPKRQDSDEEEEEDNWEEEAPSQVIPAVPVSPSANEAKDLAGQGLCGRALYDYQAEDGTEISFDVEHIITNIEQIDPGWWKGTAPNGCHGMFPSNYVELLTSNQPAQVITPVPAASVSPSDPLEEPLDEPLDGPPEDLHAGQGLCARALYDYQAEDDTEISFDPEELITNIEQIDEGWWKGTAPNGRFGMFPANYVELI